MVRRYIGNHPELTIPVEVIDKSVRRDGDFWYVSIRPGGEVRPRPYVYYDVLAEVEGEIEENEHLNIMLVPSG